MLFHQGGQKQVSNPYPLASKDWSHSHHDASETAFTYLTFTYDTALSCNFDYFGWILFWAVESLELSKHQT